MINWHHDPNSWGRLQGETALDQEALEAENLLLEFVDHNVSRGRRLEQHRAVLESMGIILYEEGRDTPPGPPGYSLIKPQMPEKLAEGQMMIKGWSLSYLHPMGEASMRIDQVDVTKGFRRRVTFHHDGARTTIDTHPANTYEMQDNIMQYLDPRQVLVNAVDQLDHEAIQPFYRAAGLDEHGREITD